VRVELAQGGRVVVYGHPGGDPRVGINEGDIAALVGGLGSLSGRNLIINGDFQINQREYVSGAALGSGAYGFDRWKVNAATNLTFTTAPQGQPVTVMPSRSVQQIIERAEVVADNYVLSWEGTATARAYNFGATVPTYATSPLTLTLDGSANVMVEATDGTLSKVKLERGSVATPFQARPWSDELRLCMRYYNRKNAIPYQPLGLGMSRTSSVAWIQLYYPPMRAAPTVTMGGSLIITDRLSYDLTANYFGTSVIGVDSAYMTVNHSGTATVHRAAQLSASSGTAGYVALDAEL